ncbi:HD domain-containing protein [Massilia sp.]|uniref:HD domain-containing protein n=1 Tax=Massilia sp. TaxID=1882437 RepID=UPI002FC67A80
MPDYLFNHVLRSWIFATRIAAMHAIAYDAEVVAVSTILHDIGLTPLGDGPHRFEVNGAEIAADFVRRLGFDARRVQLVWDSVALHVTPSISLFKETEVALCTRGIGVDFGTPDYSSFDQAEIDAIVTAVPRLNMVRQFMSCTCQMARDRPETTYDNFMRDFGERHVPGYQAPSWVDRILNGPYAE